jgi:septal ring factor EnvC (AmiA/AmiB activator)
VRDVRALKSLGDIQMPISGIIRTGYGASDYLGSASQGIKIEGRAGGLVVAPMNGVVRYKGSFKNYGNMIIIEHAKNYHSLVAGLAKIDTVVGQSVMAGEPVGALGAARGARPALYYELRQNGKPVNPARIFADLG